MGYWVEHYGSLVHRIIGKSHMADTSFPTTTTPVSRTVRRDERLAIGERHETEQDVGRWRESKAGDAKALVGL